MDMLAPQGFYHADETKMVTPYRHFNTWMGDPVRVMLAANQNMMIERDGLLENVTKTGAVLQDGMPSLPPQRPASSWRAALRVFRCLHKLSRGKDCCLIQLISQCTQA